jgi:hypothetical protein
MKDFLASVVIAAASVQAGPLADMLTFALGSDTLFVYRAADSKHRPRGEYFGKAEFDNAVKSKTGEKILVHILIPGNTPGLIPVTKQSLSLFVIEEGTETSLAPPASIFRMPETPFRSFAIVSANHPGRIVARNERGDEATLDLGLLPGLSLHWLKKPSEKISEEPPASLFGKLP